MKHNLLKIVWFCFGIIFTIIALELYLKGTEIKLPYKKFDSVFGSSYQTNKAIHIHKEGFFLGKTNKFGFVGYIDGFSSKNYNIAFYGDSFTEAFQLNEENNFTSLLEKELNKKTNIKTTVLNFGISNVLLKDIYIRKKTLGSKFKTNLNVYFLDNIQFIQYSEGVFNGLDVKENYKKLQLIPSNSKSFLLYKKIAFFVENSSCLNLFLDMIFVLKRNQFSLFETKSNSSKIFDTSINNVDRYDIMPKINNLILNELEKENSIIIFKETIDPKVRKLLKTYKIPVFECKPILDSLRNKGINPYYWERTKTIGHFNQITHKVLAKHFSNIILNYKKTMKSDLFTNQNPN